MIEHILHDGQKLATLLRTSYNNQGIHFFTSDEESLQLAYMNRPQNYIIQPHIHKQVVRQVELTQEVLFVKSGIVRIDFYDEEQHYLESRVLKSGDVILLSLGGHGFEMLEPSEIIEVKQGPYIGEKDKIRFSGISAQEAKINEKRNF